MIRPLLLIANALPGWGMTFLVTKSKDFGLKVHTLQEPSEEVFSCPGAFKYFRSGPKSLLAATALLLLLSQIQVNAPAFSSRYNFFHRHAS